MRQMKTRSTPEEPDNIAASVKARQRSTRISQSITDDVQNSSNTHNTQHNQTANVQNSQNDNLENDQLHAHSSNDVKKAEKKKLNTVNNRKRTAKPFWSQAEKRLFFQGLRMYGKNFNEISRFIRLRANQNEVQGKTKEQVRFFYHRTWQSVRPFISTNEYVSNLAHELYGLINYSVIRNRIKKQFSARLGEKLNELVQTGTTFVRHNGKRYILRTPICPALKRLNNMRAPTQDYLLPDNITIELVPRNQASLLRVQTAEQNPRVRFKVSINRQLSDVIAHAEEKWKTANQRVRSALGLPATNSPRLRIFLVANCPLDGALSVQEVARIRSVDVALKSYQERLQQKDNQVVNEEENSGLKLDLTDIGEKMKSGVGYEEARSVKLLVLYIALGCPETIQFEYEYVTQADIESAQMSVSNALRRLLHLSASEWIDHKKKKNTKDALEEEISLLQSQLESMKNEVNQLHSVKQNNTHSVESASGSSSSKQFRTASGDHHQADKQTSSQGSHFHLFNGQRVEVVDLENYHQMNVLNDPNEDNHERVLQQLSGISKQPIVVNQSLKASFQTPQSSLAALKAFNSSRVRQRHSNHPVSLNSCHHRSSSTNSQQKKNQAKTSTSTNNKTKEATSKSAVPCRSGSSTPSLIDELSSDSRGILEQAYKMSMMCAGDTSTDSLSSFLNHLSPAHDPMTNGGPSDLQSLTFSRCTDNFQSPHYSLASPHIGSECSLQFSQLLSSTSPLKSVEGLSRDSMHNMVGMSDMSNLYNETTTEMCANIFDFEKHLYDEADEK